MRSGPWTRQAPADPDPRPAPAPRAPWLSALHAAAVFQNFVCSDNKTRESEPSCGIIGVALGLPLGLTKKCDLSCPVVTPNGSGGSPFHGKRSGRDGAAWRAAVSPSCSSRRRRSRFRRRCRCNIDAATLVCRRWRSVSHSSSPPNMSPAQFERPVRRGSGYLQGNDATALHFATSGHGLMHKRRVSIACRMAAERVTLPFGSTSGLRTPGQCDINEMSSAWAASNAGLLAYR